MRIDGLIAACRLPLAAAALVWAATRPLDGGWLHLAVYLGCVLALLAWWRPAWFTGPMTAKPPQDFDRLLPWFGVILLLNALGMLEQNSPFYFTQDDTHSEFLPLFIAAARNLFNEGVFSTWNGYLMLGMPVATYGCCMTSYPPIYAAYGLSRFILGNEYLTMEAMAWLHMLAGYFFAYRAARTLNVGQALAAGAAFSFVLCGYHLSAGRSWALFVPLIAWLPALAWSLARLAKPRPVQGKWIAGTALSLAMMFIGGFVQVAMYMAMLWCAGVGWILLCYREWPRARAALAAALLGFGLALVYMLPVYLELKDTARVITDRGEGIMRQFQSMLLPFPLVISQPNPMGPNASMYYSGSLFIWGFFLAAAVAVAEWARGGGTPSRAARHVFTILALLVLLYSFGPEGKLWSWLAQWPVLSKFRWPSRALPLVALFLTLAGAVALQQWLQGRRYGRGAMRFIALLVMVMVTYNTALPTTPYAFWRDRPYPPLPEPLQKVQAEGFTTVGRGYPTGPWRSSLEHYTLTLRMNYPALYNIPVGTGYEGNGQPGNSTLGGSPPNLRALARWEADRPAFLKAFAFDWVSGPMVRGMAPHDATLIRWLMRHFTHTLSVPPSVRLYFIRQPDTQPMAWSDAAPATALAYRLGGKGVEVRLAEPGPQRITLAWLHRHWMHGYDDRGQALPITADEWGRIVIDAPAGAKTVAMRYQPPWHIGWGIFGACVLAAAWLMRKSWQRNS